MRCCLRVSEPRRAALAVPLGGARHERGEHARDGERLRHARDRRSTCRSGPGGQRHRSTGRDPLAGAPQPQAGARAPGRGGGHRHPAGRRELRHGPLRDHRAAAAGQDRHRRHPHECVVRRCDPSAHRRRLGRVPRGADPDGTAPHAHHRLRGHMAGPDLAAVHVARRGRPPRTGVPDPGGRLPLGVGRRIPVAVLPAERLHAAPEHRHAAVHRGHASRPRCARHPRRSSRCPCRR